MTCMTCKPLSRMSRFQCLISPKENKYTAAWEPKQQVSVITGDQHRRNNTAELTIGAFIHSRSTQPVLHASWLHVTPVVSNNGSLKLSSQVLICLKLPELSRGRKPAPSTSTGSFSIRMTRVPLSFQTGSTAR